MQLVKVEEVKLQGNPESALDWQRRDRTMWRWTFAGYSLKDQKKTTQNYEYLTGTSVGTKDSNLKSMLQQMLPEASLSELQNQDTDELVGKNWRVRVGKEQNAVGHERNTLISIEESEVSYSPFDNE